MVQDVGIEPVDEIGKRFGFDVLDGVGVAAGGPAERVAEFGVEDDGVVGLVSRPESCLEEVGVVGGDVAIAPALLHEDGAEIIGDNGGGRERGVGRLVRVALAEGFS